MIEDRKEISPQAGESRREVVKRIAYVAPVVLTLAAVPSFASVGSGRPSHGQEFKKGPRRSSINN